MVRDDRPETPCYKRFPDTPLDVKTFLYLQQNHYISKYSEIAKKDDTLIRGQKENNSCIKGLTVIYVRIDSHLVHR